MIEFRQKTFGRFRAALKKAGEDPVKTGLAASGTILGVANLSLNMSRKKKDTELREEQRDAMNNLADALIISSNNPKVVKKAKRMKASFRKKHPETIEEEDLLVLPNPVSMVKKKSKKK